MPFSALHLLDPKRSILVFGSDGQVGREVKAYLENLNIPAIFLGRSQCDLSDAVELLAVLNRYRPQIIINAAAYTAVDKAESEINLADAINAKAPLIMADYLVGVANGTMVHFSTDYVYSGSLERPYLESDSTGPLSQYGKSKLEGDLGIEEIFKNYPKSHQSASRYFILRTSWVYGQGNNFIRTILRLAQERDQLRIVADQYGAPSSANWLAKVALVLTASRLAGGIYHAVPDGVATWHDLAVCVVQSAAQYEKQIRIKPESILPISSEEYPVAAVRPKNSRLDNRKLKLALIQLADMDPYPRWQDQVDQYVKQEVLNIL
jgi:dTDP-4-dehydrorhamnose reductase